MLLSTYMIYLTGTICLYPAIVPASTKWFSLCPYYENHGMGQQFNKSSWYNTYQFTADLLFYARAVNHPCRTYDLSSALIFYIPFDTSLFVHSFGGENYLTQREALWVDFLDYISRLPTFQQHGGHDHFLVSGIMVWDFIRAPNMKDKKIFECQKPNRHSLPVLFPPEVPCRNYSMAG
ncbi:Xyloglucan galactosyltransferase KATAMARI1 [Carex littledalei]|uniref:Xyloglucan galactosyltransferase KATAMARI1 n=1 Tax=Carex littledalei TaxID=544730 RepID=A0A833VEH4_9POAL|nr:Xyloglucan galactosyltransferase KATAMARI1 [Carex littledalei]